MDKMVDMAMDFDSIDLTIKFRYWSCSDAQTNRKNTAVVLKELI